MSYADFIADRARHDVFLWELEPLDASLAAETIRVSTRPFITKPGNTPPNALYRAIAQTGFDFESPTFTVGTLGYLQSEPRGQVALRQRFGSLDSWILKHWGGARVTCRHGGYSRRTGWLTYSDFRIVRICEAASFLAGLDQGVLELSSVEDRLSFPVERRRLGGFTAMASADGTTGFVGFSNPAKLDLRNDMTVEFWVLPWTYPGSEEHLYGWASGAFRVTLTSTGAIRFRWNEGGAQSVTSTYELVPGRKYHVAIAVSDAEIRIRIYDHVEDDTVGETFAAGGYNGRDAAAGTVRAFCVFGGTDFSDSAIWEVRVWGSTLTDETIDGRRNRPLDDVEITDSNLKHNPRFDELSGANVTDYSPSPQDGTVNGTVERFVTLTGQEDIRGTQLPNVFGEVEGFPGLRVEPIEQVWMLHSGETESTIVPREGGAPRTIDTAYTDLRAFLQATTPPGKWDTLVCELGTYARSGTVPAGEMRFDLKGDAPGNDYVDTAVEIVRNVVTLRGQRPFADPSELDTDSFDDTLAANDAVVGYVLQDGETVAAFCQQVLGSIGGVVRVNRRTGLLSVRIFNGTAMGAAVTTITRKNVIRGGLSPVPVERPYTEVSCSFRRNWGPLEADQISEEMREHIQYPFLRKEWRQIERQDDTALGNLRKVRLLDFKTYFRFWPDAAAESLRRLNLYRTEAQAFEVEIRTTALELDVFDVVNFHYEEFDPTTRQKVDRLQTSATAKFVVLGVKEDSRKGTTRLTLWRENVAA